MKEKIKEHQKAQMIINGILALVGLMLLFAGMNIGWNLWLNMFLAIFTVVCLGRGTENINTLLFLSKEDE